MLEVGTWCQALRRWSVGSRRCLFLGYPRRRRCLRPAGGPDAAAGLTTPQGIPPEILPRVFDLFVQSSRALDRAHGGLGIGLTLVKRLVTLHGGKVQAFSEGIGHGTELVVRLPVCKVPEAPAKAAKPQAQLITSARILLIDDNVDAAVMMATLQELRGHVTRVAHSGQEGLEAAKDFRPDVVLLDIGLPGMDGYEVARNLRALPETAKVRIIAMSGYGPKRSRRV